MQITHGSTSAIRIPSARLAGYWITTVVVAFELVASFIWVVVGTQYVANNLTHLGYPHYLPNIIGVFDLPGAVVLLAPGFTRLKEWAYAGATIKYAGAVASHMFTGDGPDIWIAPLVFGILTITSWALRPPDRRMMPTLDDVEQRTARAWVVTLLMLVALVIIALLTVPA
jgi:DoxX-like family